MISRIGNILGLAAVICLFPFLNLSAQELQAPSDAEKNFVSAMAKSYQPMAARLGFDQFTFGSMQPDKTAVSLEYVKTGDNVEAWQKLSTITLYPLPQGDISEKVKSIGAGLIKIYEEKATVEKLDAVTIHDQPGFFLQYTIGEGKDQEHNAGVFAQTGPQIAAFVQIQQRGGPLAEVDIKALRDLFKLDK